MADLSPEVEARLAAIAIRQAELETRRRSYMNMIERKEVAHSRRKWIAGATSLAFAVGGAAAGFVIPPLAGVGIAAAGVAVPWWVQRKDEWDRSYVEVATKGLRAIDQEARRLSAEVVRLTSGRS